MTVLKINGLDVTKWLVRDGLDVEYNILLSDKSGRNARGNNRVEIVNRKDKLTARFRALNAAQIQEFLAAIEPYVMGVTYLSPKTGELKTITAYTGTPKVGYRVIDRTALAKSMLNEFELSFIEM